MVFSPNSITHQIRRLFEHGKRFIERTPTFMLHEDQPWVDVMMIENVLNSERLERKRNEENAVRQITALQMLESMPYINPPRTSAHKKKATAYFQT